MKGFISVVALKEDGRWWEGQLCETQERFIWQDDQQDLVPDWMWGMREKNHLQPELRKTASVFHKISF